MTNELHPDLQSWLDTATADLAEQSKVRVVEEVVRHYEEVFEEAFGSGLTPELSNEVGLTALGDPAKAAKKYGKTYLIRSEAEFLRENSSPIKAIDCNNPLRHFDFEKWKNEVRAVKFLTVVVFLIALSLAPFSGFALTILYTLLWIAGFILITALMSCVLVITAWNPIARIRGRILDDGVSRQTLRRIAVMDFIWMAICWILGGLCFYLGAISDSGDYTPPLSAIIWFGGMIPLPRFVRRIWFLGFIYKKAKSDPLPL